MFGLTLNELVHALGYAGLFGVLFAESGLFVGFFLPGDSLLFVAGFVASQGQLNILAVILVSLLGAILGDSVGYAFGRRVGTALFSRPNSRLFRREHLERAQAFYERHGSKTIVLARFVPIVRTFAPILAGVADMAYPTFVTYNVVGGIAWAAVLPVLGFFLGSVVPDIDRLILPIIGFIVVISLIPPALEYWRHSRKDRR